MYTETIQALGDQAAAKLAGQRQSLLGHLVRSMLAGMYVGVSIVLIFTIGGCLSGEATRPFQRLLMGVCFGGALTMVVFADSELFTGSNLVLTLGVLTGKASWRDLGANWLWTWVGNLLGGMLVALLVVRAGLLSADKFPQINAFVLGVFKAKTDLDPEQLILRAVLANWIVCLGVWMAARVKSEAARILLIFWCMFTFITCGFEHSVANMCGLMLGVLLPNHGTDVTLGLYFYNIGLTTFGNILGGAGFVAGMYWMGSPRERPSALSDVPPVGANGTAMVPARSPV